MLSDSLRDLLARSSAGTVLDVVVELPLTATPSHSLPVDAPRDQYIDRSAAEFEHLSAPVVAAVERLGGQVLSQAWLNHTLKVRIAASQLEQLDRARNVARIGLPRPLERQSLTR